MTEESYARPAVVAGMFYPEHEGELRATVDALLADVRPGKEKGKLVGIIVPHAGYTYSGVTAAQAYGLLREMKKATAVIIGPSHREYFDGVSVFSGSSFTTPLGAVEIDGNIRSALMKKTPVLRSSLEGHKSEHSIEVQLPFLQRTVRDLKIVPIVIGNQTREYCEELGSGIAEVVRDEDVVLVASSDLSHYYTSETAHKLDAVAIASIKDLDYRTLMKDIDLEKTEACGGGPIASVLCAAANMGADCCRILHACNSGDVSGDTERVVGYVSAAMWKTH
jgi:MEMO1 family protein